MPVKSSDSFGDRMKKYERTTKYILSPRTYTIVRVDGRAFHTLLKGAQRPFDYDVITAMNATAVALCNEMGGVRFAYTQSDEISILLTDLDPKTQPWFGGEIQKIASVSASVATAAFNHHYNRPIYNSDRDYATFDSRVYTIPSRIEVANYFLWRQQDAIRNAVSMAAESMFPSRHLMGVSVDARKEMVSTKLGVDFKTAYGDRERRGGVVVRETYSVESTPPGGRPPMVSMRRRWAHRDAPDFTLDNGGFLALQIPQEPADALQPVAPEPYVECAHEVWETWPFSKRYPYVCADCKHVFTVAEAEARKGVQQ